MAPRARILGSAFALVAALVVPLVATSTASAHGWVIDPPSRQDYCANKKTSFNCGQIIYEPWSVEGAKGLTQCSGGVGRFSILDDNSRPWPRKTIGSTVTINWSLHVSHATASWDYFVDGQLFKTFPDRGTRPGSTHSDTLTGLPSGNHTILARWTIADTANAFYNCIDVTVGGGGGPQPTSSQSTSSTSSTRTTSSSQQPTSTRTTPTPTTPNQPGQCTAPAWSSGSVYTGGQQVSYSGRTYEAKWWTQGDTPGQGGEWGVWTDRGACSGGPAPTSSQSPSTQPTSTRTTSSAQPTTNPSTPNPPSSNPGSCSAAAWSASTSYSVGDHVTYNGRLWMSQWWSTGVTPGSAIAYNIWQDHGAC